MKKTIDELQMNLAHLKERENQIKEEMEILRKSADVKEQRKRKGLMFSLAEIVMDCLGEEVLEQQNEFEEFLQKFKTEWFLERGARGGAS